MFSTVDPASKKKIKQECKSSSVRPVSFLFYLSNSESSTILSNGEVQISLKVVSLRKAKLTKSTV